MAVDRELIRKLVKVTNDYDRQQSPSTFAYGTVVDGANGQHFVKIDGSEWQVPIAFGTDAQRDDRVLVRVENHKATVLGNLSTPASARTATDFMRFQEDEEGNGKLYIGRLDASGNPTDSYVVIDPDSFDIWSGGFVWASLGKEATTFWVNGQKSAEFGKDGVVLYGDNTPDTEDGEIDSDIEEYSDEEATENREPLKIAVFGKEWTDIRKGIRLLDEFGETHDIVAVEYDADGDKYDINFGEKNENTEVSIRGGMINILGTTLMVSPDFGKEDFNMANTLLLMSKAGPVDAINFFVNWSKMYIDTSYENYSFGVANQDWSNRYPSTHAIKLEPGVYIVTAHVYFTETTSTRGSGWRNASIIFGSDTKAIVAQGSNENSYSDGSRLTVSCVIKTMVEDYLTLRIVQSSGTTMGGTYSIQAFGIKRF